MVVPSQNLAGYCQKRPFLTVASHLLGRYRHLDYSNSHSFTHGWDFMQFIKYFYAFRKIGIIFVQRFGKTKKTKT